jgi:hypothetical protein
VSNISATQTHRLNASEWIIFKWAIFQLYHGVNKFLITLWRCLLVLNQNGELKFSSCGSNQRSMWDIVINLSVIICVHWLHIQSEITRSNVTKLGRNVTRFSTLYVCLVLFWNSTWLPKQIVLFDWLNFQISSSQKPHVWWNCYMVSIY